jgi:hypothetical protein
MRRNAQTALALALVAAVAACSDVAELLGIRSEDRAPRTEMPALRTDAFAYTLHASAGGVEGKIAFTFTNPARHAVHIVHCNRVMSLHLEKRVGNAWVTAWTPVVPMCLSEPIVLQPGQVYHDTVHVFGGYPASNFYPKFTVADVPGEYRLVWDAVLKSFNPRGASFGEPLPLAQRTSNAFTLAVE